MEGNINGISDRFFSDLTEDYLENQKNSFLYKDIWSEKMQELLKKHFPELLEPEPPKPDGAKELVKKMRGIMTSRPEWARGLMLREVEKGKLWENLFLNNIGYRMKLITDAEYYLWLVEYLAAHNLFKASIFRGSLENREPLYGYRWVEPLLRRGLGMNSGQLKAKIKTRKKTQDNGEKYLSKPETDEALLMLAEQIQEDRDLIAGRLHDLKYNGKDYLPILNARLERLALHFGIRESLQNSGYPLKSTDEKSTPKVPRKKEPTWRRFVAYCDSENGYYFSRKGDGGWHVDEHGFCVLDTDWEQLKNLIEAHENAQGIKRVTRLYIPLAVHLKTGCVFFLAGKNYYEKVYQEERRRLRQGEELWAKFQAAKGRYCFDYLRQDPLAFDMVDDERRMIPSFRLAPAFHIRAVNKNEEINYYKLGLAEFMGYCEGSNRRDTLHTVREYNNLAQGGGPKNFLWAFDGEEQEQDLD